MTHEEPHSDRNTDWQLAVRDQEIARLRRLIPSNEDAKHELAAAMREASEDLYQAGWVLDLEFYLWGIVNADIGTWPTGRLGTRDDTARTLRRIARLALRLDCWMRDSEVDPLVPLSVWRGMYGSWKMEKQHEQSNR